MYGVAPDVETSIPYDIIVYEDSAQFHLEKCEPICLEGSIKGLSLKKSFEEFRSDLISCLQVLHGLHIVHVDIKPDNILYC